MRFLIVIVTLICSHSSSSQESWKVISYEDQNISCKIRLADALYEIGDTLKIMFYVKNISNKDVLFFEPIIHDSQFKENKQIYRFGSNWTFRLGYNLGSWRKIKAGKTFLKELQLVIAECKGEEDKFETQDWIVYNGVTGIRLISFRGVYFDKINMIEMNEEKVEQNLINLIGFVSVEDGAFFENNLNRFTIGTVEIRLTK